MSIRIYEVSLRVDVKSPNGPHNIVDTDLSGHPLMFRIEAGSSREAAERFRDILLRTTCSWVDKDGVYRKGEPEV